MTDGRETDLFGNPVRPRKGLRGRPVKEMSGKDLDMLEAGLMKGWSNQRIADVLGVSLSTLKRNFGPLLKERGEIPDRLQLALFSATVRKAIEKGDMGAIRQLRQMMTEDKAALAAQRLKSDEEEDDPDQDKKALGKKELQRQHAKRLTDGEGTETWGSDLKPGYTN